MAGFRVVRLPRGGGAPVPRDVPPQGLVVGRSGADLSFPEDETVSPRHARLVPEGQELRVEDLGSTNGLFLRLKAPHPLVEGDRFVCGDTVFRISFAVARAPESEFRFFLSPSEKAPVATLTRILADGRDGEVFPIPDDLVEGDTLPGTDGQAKMSKSLGNVIFLADDAATVRKRVHSMYTDPHRIRADIPGTVEGNPVFTYLDQFDPAKATVEELKARYRAGKVGDVEVKERLTNVLNAFLDPIRARSAYYASQSGLVDEIIYEGTLRYREVAAETLREVKKAMGLTGTFNRIARKAEERKKKLARRQDDQAQGAA
jgi:pSer/pThr/pTyr-binding forkhead associated (FHA) protein